MLQSNTSPSHTQACNIFEPLHLTLVQNLGTLKLNGKYPQNRMNRSGQIKEQALVLKSIRHGETSRIITLFGRTLGKFAVIAKGVRRSKSSSSGSGLEPPAHVESIIYYKPGRSVQNIGLTSVIEGYKSLKTDLALTGYAAVILEQINRLFIDGEPNNDAFTATCAALDTLDSGNPRITLWKFQLTILRNIGFALDPFTCPVCAAPIAEISRRNSLLLEHGAICCSSCSNDSFSVNDGEERFTLSGESVSLLRRLSNGNGNALTRITPSINAHKELSRALELFLRFHHPNVGALPAMRMLEQLE